MTVGERNRKIVRMVESGMTATEAGEKVGLAANAAQKVMSRYRYEGDAVFNSQKEWDGEETKQSTIMDGLSKQEQFTIEGIGVTQKIDMLRRTIREGDVIRFYRDNRAYNGTVKGVYPNCVYVEYEITPAHSIFSKGEKVKLSTSLTYIDLVEGGTV